MKFTITFTARQTQKIEALAEKLGCTKEELVRAALDVLFRGVSHLEKQQTTKEKLAPPK